jgi:hypothetical protein
VTKNSLQRSLIRLMLKVFLPQVDHYGERKRPYTAVHDDLSGRNRQTYDRLRTVNHPFSMRRITVVRRRVVYGKKRTSFTLKSMP